MDPGENGERILALVESLGELVRETPLERVAAVAESLPALAPHFIKLVTAYDSFLGMLDDADIREQLDALEPSDADSDPVYQQARTIGHEFQEALDEIFFGDHGTDIPALTRKYGVF